MDDRTWIDEVLRRYEQPLLLFARRILRGDIEAARDVVQDVFLKLCEQGRDEVADHLSQWLFTVCRHRAIDHLRKERPMRLMTDPEALGAAPTKAPVDLVAYDDEKAHLACHLAALTDRHRDVLRLKFVDGLSYREIAERLDIGVGNVGFILHHAIRRLRERMGVEVKGVTA